MKKNVRQDNMTGSYIDLDMVKSILKQVSAEVDRLDGAFLPDYSYTAKRHDASALTRQLLVMADHLELASNLVRNEYWISKGQDDALEG